jgi:hypothetical protein
MNVAAEDGGDHDLGVIGNSGESEGRSDEVVRNDIWDDAPNDWEEEAVGHRDDNVRDHSDVTGLFALG